MQNIIKFPHRDVPAQKSSSVDAIIETDTEHACTRQSRILYAWLLDSADDPDVGIDWAIQKLKTATEIAEVRRVFIKKK